MILRLVGKLFITAGVLILLFLGYQLFGTNFVAARHQEALAQEFEETIGSATPAPEPEEFKPDLGDGIARIQIPKIEVDWVVVYGVSVDALKRGPGFYPGTTPPGENGNTVISGHRTTYGAPFFRLDELQAGDTIRLVSMSGIHSYRISETKVVAPTDVAVTADFGDSRITLTTCHPRFSARQRLIVVGRLLEEDRSIE